MNRKELASYLTAGMSGPNQYVQGEQQQALQGLKGQQELEQERVKADLAQKNVEANRKAGLEMLSNPKLRALAPKGASIVVDPHTGAIHFGADPAAGIVPEVSLTPGQKAADTTYGKEYADYNAGGGYATVEKHLGELEKASGEAEKQSKLQQYLGHLPRFLRTVVAPQSVSIEDKVRDAVQGTLRQTLGSQFTEKEGEAMMKRSYDPALSAAENKARIDKNLQELKIKAAAKDKAAKYFERTGTLKGLGAASDPVQVKAPAAGGGGGLSPAEQAELEQLRKEMGK